MKSSLTESPDNNKPRIGLALALTMVSLVCTHPPLTRESERKVIRALAAILRQVGFDSEQIAKGLPTLQRFHSNDRLTAKALDQYEEYKTISASPWEVLLKLVGADRTNAFKDRLERITTRAASGRKEGVEPC